MGPLVCEKHGGEAVGDGAPERGQAQAVRSLASPFFGHLLIEIFPSVKK